MVSHNYSKMQLNNFHELLHVYSNGEPENCQLSLTGKLSNIHTVKLSKIRTVKLSTFLPTNSSPHSHTVKLSNIPKATQENCQTNFK